MALSILKADGGSSFRVTVIDNAVVVTTAKIIAAVLLGVDGWNGGKAKDIAGISCGLGDRNYGGCNGSDAGNEGSCWGFDSEVEGLATLIW